MDLIRDIRSYFDFFFLFDNPEVNWIEREMNSTAHTSASFGLSVPDEVLTLVDAFVDLRLYRCYFA